MPRSREKSALYGFSKDNQEKKKKRDRVRRRVGERGE